MPFDRTNCAGRKRCALRAWKAKRHECRASAGRTDNQSFARPRETESFAKVCALDGNQGDDSIVGNDFTQQPKVSHGSMKTSDTPLELTRREFLKDSAGAA